MLQVEEKEALLECHVSNLLEIHSVNGYSSFTYEGKLHDFDSVMTIRFQVSEIW